MTTEERRVAVMLVLAELGWGDHVIVDFDSFGQAEQDRFLRMARVVIADRNAFLEDLVWACGGHPR